jgi:RNA polymerase sigma factor (sigma-70 family)
MGERHAAFAVLVERFQAMALALASEGCGDVESARDACQSAFLLAWRRLDRLREEDAFGGWLKRLVRTQCARTRQRCADRCEGFHVPEPVPNPAERVAQQETRRLLWRAVRSLPAAEREAVTRVYFHGETLEQAGTRLGATTAQVGKLVYRARLGLRRSLPREVARAFLPKAPSTAFARSVQAGLLDELVGTYRFAERPQCPVVFRRVGSRLVAVGGGQRNVLAARRDGRLAATEFDGEARFLRDRRGQITGFVYYEFGRRLGVARRTG